MNPGLRPPSHNVGYSGYNRVIDLLRKLDRRRLAWIAFVGGLPYLNLILELFFVPKQSWSYIFSLLQRGNAFMFVLGIVVWELLGVMILWDADSAVRRTLAFIVFVFPTIVCSLLPLFWSLLWSG